MKLFLEKKEIPTIQIKGTRTMTPKLSTAQHLAQIAIGDEWLAENKKAIQPPKKKKAKKSITARSMEKTAKRVATQCEKRRKNLIQSHKAKLTKLLKDEFIPRKTVAKALGVSTTTLLRWAEKDQFPKTYFKKLREERPTTCYKNSDLLEFLNKY